ncbi:TlpA family protein disulfide reductase [Mycolicibacterium lutetiense]|uniref:Thiol-disulfide isomerase/thioredoxin n=1 Tax=Mycolicibacterium lutetiense TaxID=1641992 RepID=A0ABS4ZS92_9MYCO|nr:TlpA disulfide reductase family protein [Mycolicibacterium lutetiense]MBP2452344.1 thiol-disulfide isomerase/thioredoxin [Mycolicibacterium lutetiense]
MPYTCAARVFGIALIGALATAGCSTGRDAVAQGGSFEFVSPGGKTDLFYDPAHIWGSWCGPCRTETPQLEKVFDETESLGVAFLGIDVRDSRSAATDFVTDRNVRYPSIFDPPMRSLMALGKGYPSSVVPTTLILDRRHRVAAIFLRALLAEDLRPVVLRVARES